MSISSVNASPWQPIQTTSGSPVSAQSTGSSSTPSVTSGTTTNPLSSPSNPTQQLSAELQSFLLQLQGPSGTTAAGQTGPSSGTQTAGTDPTGTGAVSGAGHHHHHHGGGGHGGVTEASSPTGSTEEAGAPASGQSAASSGDPLQSLATDIARALQSYSGGAAASLSAPTATSALPT